MKNDNELPLAEQALFDALDDYDAEARDSVPPDAALVNSVTDLEVRDHNGDTLLVRAAEKGAIDLVRALVNAGADIDAAGMNDTRPLHMACYRGHQDVADFLVDAGADMTIKDTLNRRTPQDWARGAGYLDLYAHMCRRSWQREETESQRQQKDLETMALRHVLRLPGTIRPKGRRP